MPELPEVQTIVNDLVAARICGRVIGDARISWAKTVNGVSPKAFIQAVRGKRIHAIGRRAKYLVFKLDPPWHVVVHLRMTGRFILDDGTSSADRHVRAILDLDDGRRLLFYDTRKFGRFYLVNDLITFFSSLGPEPLDDYFTAARFTTMLGKKHRQIKPLLLDQHFLAGLGNIYVDEALWSAHVHPLRSADSLTAKEVKNLHRAIRHVLRKGLQNAGTSLGNGKTNFASIQRHRGGNSNHLKVFRKTGEPCPRCRTAIERIIVGQRSTHICPVCQSKASEQ